jgi:hypothetical protein
MPRSILFLAVAASVLAQTPAPKPKTANDYVAQLVAKLTPTRKIVYKKIADRELSLHVFQPEGWKASDKRVCYITIHGGGDPREVQRQIDASLARNNAEVQMQLRRQMREGVLS